MLFRSRKVLAVTGLSVGHPAPQQVAVGIGKNHYIDVDILPVGDIEVLCHVVGAPPLRVFVRVIPFRVFTIDDFERPELRLQRAAHT